MKIAARFVKTAASAADFPRDGLAEVALVGRSNVGKSTLINALVRQRVARTSAAPGKTRLANIYRIERERVPALYLVDLPGYGFARGGSAGFDELVRAYFGSDRRADAARGLSRAPDDEDAARGFSRAPIAALLVVDARHPGLDNDRAAWDWLGANVERRAAVATKIDKLARGERIRALRELESVLEHPVLPVSAVTGEGLDELWKAIDRLANNSRRRSRSNSSLPGAAAAPRRRKS